MLWGIWSTAKHTKTDICNDHSPHYLEHINGYAEYLEDIFSQQGCRYFPTQNSQHGPEHGNGVIPEPTAPGPALHHFDGDRFGFGDVAFLPLTHVGSERPVIEQDVVLVIEFEASAVHVGGTDQCYFPVKGQGLGVQ